MLMRYCLLLAVLLCVGCSYDADETSPSNLPAVGSVYNFEISYRDTTFTRADTITRGPFRFEGRQFVYRVGDDVFRPLMYAYASNGNIARYLPMASSWLDMNFGTKQPRRYRDSVFRGPDWVISEQVFEYRDTVLEIQGEVLNGVKEQMNWNQKIFRLDGSVIDSESAEGIEFDVWIPSICYYGLTVSDPGTPDEYFMKLISFDRK
jgi:hypothetical protein